MEFLSSYVTRGRLFKSFEGYIEKKGSPKIKNNFRIIIRKSTYKIYNTTAYECGFEAFKELIPKCRVASSK